MISACVQPLWSHQPDGIGRTESAGRRVRSGSRRGPTPSPTACERRHPRQACRLACPTNPGAPGRRRGRRRSLERSRLAALGDAKFRKHRLSAAILASPCPSRHVCGEKPLAQEQLSLGLRNPALVVVQSGLSGLWSPLVRLPWSLQRPSQPRHGAPAWATPQVGLFLSAPLLTPGLTANTVGAREPAQSLSAAQRPPKPTSRHRRSSVKRGSAPSTSCAFFGERSVDAQAAKMNAIKTRDSDRTKCCKVG